MKASATILTNYHLQTLQLLQHPSTNILLSSHRQPSTVFFPTKSSFTNKQGSCCCRAAVRAPNGLQRPPTESPWDEKPYEILPNGNRAYLDEQDVVTFLDPPIGLIPLDPASYNPAAYLWKKIDDVPEERRHRLVKQLEPRLISRAWEIAGTRYADSKLAKKIASKVLPCEDGERLLEYYHCRSSGGPFLISWMKFFKKVRPQTLLPQDINTMFASFSVAICFSSCTLCNDHFQFLLCRLCFVATMGRSMGDLLMQISNHLTSNSSTAGGAVGRIANAISPLYFLTTETREVMSTEQPCDLAYEFGDGHLNLDNYPLGFPKPGKHPYPFDDHIVVYVRHIGPGVLVGQAWQEGKELDQVPRKLCGEILMVKDYGASTG
ncbi:hypothetical protein LINPERPRIM_LOCUS26678 [Linum perenne]